MLPKPHGGALVNRVLKGDERDRAAQEAPGLPQLDLNAELAT